MPIAPPPTPVRRLTLRFKKIQDGGTALSLTRADGTITWQRIPAAHAEFFARHDLTHYAVETILGFALGFYGLIAAGWNFSDFAAPWPRGPIPADADPAELIVGFFDAERAGDREWTPEEFHLFAARYCASDAAARIPAISMPQLTAIRAAMRGLFLRWDALKPGESLELPFLVPPPPLANPPAASRIRPP